MDDEIVLRSKVERDEYTDYVSQAYDYKWDGESITRVPCFPKWALDSRPWQIGCICGDSGSGKSTILREIGGATQPTPDPDRPIVSQFGGTPEDAVATLQAVGLSSVPVYFHRPRELSMGQRARFELALAVSSQMDRGGVVVVDEFTSVVNRACAKSMSYAVQRFVRSKGVRLVVASCHFDIMDWLRPDWVFNLNKRENGRPQLEWVEYADGYRPYAAVKESKILTREVAI